VAEQPRDVAINGRGFLQVLQPDGTIAYTRNGQLQLNSTGQIVNSDGLVIDPAITVPQGTSKIVIGTDGSVNAYTTASPATPQQLGNITLADFVNPAGLQAIGGNLFVQTVASGTPQQGAPNENGMGSLLQGQLESSNVDIVEEMVNMITTQRAYEMNSKVVSTADKMLQDIAQNL